MKLAQTMATAAALLVVGAAFADQVTINSGDDGILSSGTCIPGFELHEPSVTTQHPGDTIPGTSWLHPDASNEHTTCSVYVATFTLPEGYGKARIDMDTLVDDTLKVFLNGNLFGDGGGFEFVHKFSTSNARFFRSGLNTVRFEAYSGFGAFGIDFKMQVTFTPGDATLDSDGDGMPDWWEIQGGLDPGHDDRASDPDHEGLSNLDEWRARTNPRQADTDEDGLKDGEEAALGTSPTAADTDGDGFSDSVEKESGSNPLSAASVPARKVVEIRSGFDTVLARSCGVGSFISAVKVGKIDPWDIIPGTSWIHPNPQSAPFSCTTYKAAFDLPLDFQTPDFEMILLSDGELTLRLNDQPLGKFSGFTQPPSIVKAQDRSFFVVGENHLEMEFHSDGGGDGIDFLATVSYSQTKVIATPPCGYTPLNVQFQLDGALTFESVVWDFGDGASSNEQSPTHAYSAAGSYAVAVTARIAGGGDVKLGGGTVQVFHDPPRADFSASSNSGASPLELQLTDRSTGEVSRRRWDFGDGSTSTDTSPSHTYEHAGSYQIQLVVTGPCAGVPANESSALKTVEVGSVRKVTLEQKGPHCVVLILESDVAVAGGEIGIAYDPAAVVPVKIAPGADLPNGGEIRSNLEAQVICDADLGVKAGVTAAWINPLVPGSSTPPGRHQLLKICFEPAEGTSVGNCSPLRFVICLGVPAAPVRNVATGEDGNSIPLSSLDGEVCMREELPFRRGDATADGNLDVSDAISVLRCLFLGEVCPVCRDAADANDDGLLNIADPVYLLLWRFSGGAPPPPPFAECGIDPTRDDLDECESFAPCP